MKRKCTLLMVSCFCFTFCASADSQANLKALSERVTKLENMIKKHEDMVIKQKRNISDINGKINELQEKSGNFNRSINALDKKTKKDGNAKLVRADNSIEQRFLDNENKIRLLEQRLAYYEVMLQEARNRIQQRTLTQKDDMSSNEYVFRPASTDNRTDQSMNNGLYYDYSTSHSNGSSPITQTFSDFSSSNAQNFNNSQDVNTPRLQRANRATLSGSSSGNKLSLGKSRNSDIPKLKRANTWGYNNNK